MKTLFKVMILILSVVMVLFAGYQTEQGKTLLAQVMSSTFDIKSMIEKEKTKDINAVIDISTAIQVDGYGVTIADLLQKNVLILPYREGCAPCDQLIQRVAATSNVRFVVLGFSNFQPQAPKDISNEAMIFASTPLEANKLKMDSYISPVIYHVSTEGRIIEKFVGADLKTLPALLQKFRG
jgi:hypothetical protein